MLTSLGDVFRVAKQSGAASFDRIEGAYWWLAEHHEGQGSWQYAALCRLGEIYTPGAATKAPADPTVYDALCERNQCHGRAGLYGDGSLGHQHTRNRCADTLEHYARTRFIDRGLVPPAVAYGPSMGPLILADALRHTMPDDAGDEYAACDWLDEYAPHPTAAWGWRDGDFGLWESDED